MKNIQLSLHGKFRSLMRLAVQLDRSPKQFGTDELLSHSEIHLIEIIGDHEGLSVTDIGNCLGITKGAVSQSLKKLEHKGYSAKKTDPDNLSRSIVSLTAKGQTAYWAHKHWHETMDGGFSHYLESLNDDELRIIMNFLTRTEDFLVRRLKSLD
jgi:DNA-binding MarR family transcriptional regulator